MRAQKVLFLALAFVLMSSFVGCGIEDSESANPYRDLLYREVVSKGAREIYYLVNTENFIFPKREGTSTQLSVALTLHKDNTYYLVYSAVRAKNKRPSGPSVSFQKNGNWRVEHGRLVLENLGTATRTPTANRAGITLTVDVDLGLEDPTRGIVLNFVYDKASSKYGIGYPPPPDTRLR